MANAIIIEPLAVAGISASSTAVGAAAHLLTDYRGIIWRGAPGATNEIAIDLGTDQALDTIMLFGLWGDLKASARVTIGLATTAQGPGREDASKFWVSPEPLLPFAGTTVISDRNGVFFHQLPPEAPAAARYIWITFTGLAGGYAEASRLVVNKAIRWERNFANGARLGVRDLGSLDYSPRGVLLRRRARKLRTIALTFSSLLKDEVKAMVQPLIERIGNTEMIALVTDPSPDAMRQTCCFYGPLVGDLGATHRKANFYEASINVVSQF